MPTRTIIVKQEDDRAHALAAVQQTRLPFSIVVRPPRKKYRRSQQNLLFAVIRHIAIELGNNGREECDIVKEEILSRQLGVIRMKAKMPGGEEVVKEKRRSTKDLDKDGMGQLIDKIYAEAANAGIIVPPPEQMHIIAETNPFYDK